MVLFLRSLPDDKVCEVLVNTDEILWAQSKLDDSGDVILRMSDGMDLYVRGPLEQIARKIS